MKQYITTFLFIHLTPFLFAQAPLVKEWDKRFGGTGADELRLVEQTNDGGYILGGISWSDSSGDKTQPAWGQMYGHDYWIVKIDSLGNKQWDKDFGGTSDEILSSIKQTTDGGYIIGGSSNSGISGNKTQPTWGGGYPYDYWVVKIDSLGNKQWDKDFGSTFVEFLFDIRQTRDGGYILGGSTPAGITGDKTQPGWGSSDYWIVKIDSSGNIQWDKDFGGTDADKLHWLQQTVDGGYILGGFSESGIGGDRTQDGWGRADYWIIKIDSLGNKQWDKRFGGNGWDELHSLQQTKDKGYILGGQTDSGISGDKTQPSWGGYWGYDYWIVKVDSLGNKQWDKDFGGTEDEDEFGNISQTFDGGYLIAGTSYSQISGDKSEANLGIEQTWVIKTDSLGIKQWDKTLHTNTTTDDESGVAIQTNDGCYVMANSTFGGIGGDKTQSNWGSSDDYWIIKFCDTTLFFIFSSNVTCYGRFDGSAKVKVLKGFSPYQYQWSNGDTTSEIFNLPAGTYGITVTDSRGTTRADSVNITEPALLSLSSLSIDVSCRGGNDGIAGVAVSGGTEPYNILWNNGTSSETVTGLLAGTYTVTVIDTNNCTATTTVNITQPLNLIITTTSVTTHVTCYSASDGAAKAIASGGTLPYSFLWSDGQTTDVPTGFPAGTHSVTVTDANGCTATTSITIAEGTEFCTGIQNNPLNNILLYPNPTTGTMTLKGEMPSLRGMASLSITLYDAIGKQVFKQTFGEDQLRAGIPLDLNDLPGSIFFLNVTTEAGSRVMKVAKY